MDKGITYEYKSDYDLLIILSKNGHAGNDSLTHITNKLEELNLPTPLNPIFHGIDFANNELREGFLLFLRWNPPAALRVKFSKKRGKAKASSASPSSVNNFRQLPPVSPPMLL